MVGPQADRSNSASETVSSSLGWAITRGASWQSWHHQLATLVMLAHFFVVREMLRLPKTARPDRAPNLLLVDAALPCTGALRPWYCEYLFQQYEFSLHY